MSNENLLSKIRKSKGYKVHFLDIDNIVDKNYIKSLREKLDMSQLVFADLLGVSKKTIEKWEQGANPIKGCSSRLVYLLYNDTNLINKFYSVKIINDDKIQKYDITINDETSENYDNIIQENYKFKNNYKTYDSNNTNDDDREIISMNC